MIFSKGLQARLAPIEHEHFWHIGRKQIILAFTPRQGKMLDIGCGNGSVTSYLASYGIDIEGQEGLEVSDLQYTNYQYDTIGLFDVLEHIVNDVEAIISCRESLVEGGYLVLTIPAYRNLWGYQDNFAGHHRRYSKKGIISVLQALNFEIERISFFNMFLLPLAYLIKKIPSANLPVELRVFPVINGICLALMELECFMLRYSDLPFGSSLIVRARKRGVNA